MNDGYEEVRIGPKKVKIPEEWQRVSLESISKNSGQYGANQSAIPFDENEYRYIRVTDLTENGHLSNEEKKSIPKEDNEKYELKNGDIVFARTGTPGLTYVFNENDSNIDYAFAGYLIRFELKDNIDSNYLSYYTQSYHYWSWIKSTQRSTTLSNINASEFRTLPIIKPSSSEQRRIAEILSIVDDAIQKTDEVIEKAERLKKGLMQDLLTKGIGHDEFKEVQIGPKTVEIPVEWEVEKLGNFSKIIVPQRDKPKRFEGNVPWIRIEDLDGKYLDDSKSGKRVSEELIDQMNLRPYPEGTVLCSCSGNMGVCAITTSVLTSNQTFAGIVPDEKINKEYLYYFLSDNAKILQTLATGTTIPYLNKGEFKKLNIPLPSQEEQYKISNMLSIIDKKIKKEERYKQKLKVLKEGLMQDLLKGKVRVNV